MADQEGRFEGVEEVAERLLVDPQTVRRWIKSGKLKAYKPGREYRILSHDLDAFLESRSSPKAPAPPPLEQEEQRGGDEERREREKYAEALMEQLNEEGECLEEKIKSSPNGFLLWRAHLFGVGLGLARALYEEIESTRQPPKALQEAKSRLDEQGELISSLWRQTIHPESGEELDEFKRFATRRAEASLQEVDEEAAHSSPRESESSA